MMHHRSRISTIASNETRRIVTSVTRAISSSGSNFWPAQKLRSVGREIGKM
jgi:glycine cleavage system regulatory protein